MNQGSGDDDTGAELFKNGEYIPAWMDVCEPDQENRPKDSYKSSGQTVVQSYEFRGFAPIELVISMTKRVPMRIGLS